MRFSGNFSGLICITSLLCCKKTNPIGSLATKTWSPLRDQASDVPATFWVLASTWSQVPVCARFSSEIQQFFSFVVFARVFQMHQLRCITIPTMELEFQLLQHYFRWYQAVPDSFQEIFLLSGLQRDLKLTIPFYSRSDHLLFSRQFFWQDPALFQIHKSFWTSFLDRNLVFFSMVWFSWNFWVMSLGFERDLMFSTPKT